MSSDEPKTPPWPKDKHDIARVVEIISLAFPANREYLPGLLGYLEELNDPITTPIVDYFRQLGETALPYVKDALKGQNEYLQFNVLTSVVGHWDLKLIREIEPMLKTLELRAPFNSAGLEALSILAKNKMLTWEQLKQKTDWYRRQCCYLIEELGKVESSFHQG